MTLDAGESEAARKMREILIRHPGGDHGGIPARQAGQWQQTPRPFSNIEIFAPLKPY